MGAQYYFDESGVRRIVGAIRRVESDPRPHAAYTSPSVASGNSQNWIRCKNDSGETIPAYSVVGVTTGATLDGSYHLYAKKPSTTFYESYGFTCSVASTSSDKVGVIFETGLVKYDTGTPTVGQGYGVKPGQFTVSLNYPGSWVCLGIVDSTLKIMRARYSPITSLIGKASGSITARAGTTPGTGTMDIWANVANVLTNTTLTATCKNLSATAVAASAYIQAKFIGGEFWVDFEDCP